MQVIFKERRAFLHNDLCYRVIHGASPCVHGRVISFLIVTCKLWPRRGLRGALPLKDVGWKCTALVLWQIVMLAAARIMSGQR
jgi:hypothetical protein